MGHGVRDIHGGERSMGKSILILVLFLAGCAAAGAGAGAVSSAVTHSRMGYLEKHIAVLERDHNSLLFWLDRTFGGNQWRTK